MHSYICLMSSRPRKFISPWQRSKVFESDLMLLSKHLWLVRNTSEVIRETWTRRVEIKCQEKRVRKRILFEEQGTEEENKERVVGKRALNHCLPSSRCQYELWPSSDCLKVLLPFFFPSTRVTNFLSRKFVYMFLLYHV